MAAVNGSAGIAQTLKANGCDADTYQLITYAGFNYEVPDASRQHTTAPFRHIGQVYDEDLNAYSFSFFIHALIDDDRGMDNITDRQRVEIKTDNGSPASMVAKEGETLIMQWKMKLPESFTTTTKFCHLHQLKGIDNVVGTADVSNPLITLTACAAGSTQKLQLRYYNRSSGEISVKKSINLAEMLGKWVEITETVTFGTNLTRTNNGRYKISIVRMSDKKELMSWTKNSEIDLWQTDCTAMRPKWGIYRYIGENRSLETILRDEEVRFADFCIEKASTAVSYVEAETADDKRVFCTDGSQAETPFMARGIYIKHGKKYLTKYKSN